MGTRGLAAVAAVAFALAAPVVRAADDDNLDKLTKTFLDEGAKVADREDALSKATGVALILKVKGPPARVEVFKQALHDVIVELGPKKADATHTKLIELAMKGMDLFTPYPEANKLVKPFLSKDTPDDARTAALRAVQFHGGAGLGKDIQAIPLEKVAKTPSREFLERYIVSCTIGLAGDEAQKVLEAVIDNSAYKGVKTLAILQFGELNSSRGSKEINAKEAQQSLLALCDKNDQELANAAALALLRFDSWAGIGKLMAKLDEGSGRLTLAVYKTICEAAHQPTGFLNLAPEKLYEATDKKREEVIAEMKLWWKKVKGAGTDQALFDAIKAAGVETPRDTMSKEAVAALIEALDIDVRSLRYAALDLLVKRTGKTDLAADFKVLKSQKGEFGMQEWEPPEGWSEKDPRREKLRQQQKQKVDKWRQWWRANSARATLVDGVWVTK